jgi:succinate dehydrogenase / fumarate reductase membrane anchor subunit
MSAPQMRTPLSRVRGLGSAKTGTEHFFRQRLTAIANIPLVIAAILIMIAAIGRNHAAVVQILGSPLVAIVLLLFILSVCYHMKLGVQTVIEDYVHDEGAKLALIIANIFFSCAVALSCVYAILKLSFGV